MDTERFNCFAVAAPDLERIVADELTRLGERPRIEAGGVSWEGDARSMMRANLWLRSASRVLVRVAQFKATAFYELEKRAKRIPWADFLGRDAGADFRVTARKSKLYHSDAIAERLSAAASRPASKTGDKRQQFIVRVDHDQLNISADTSGALLHMRGYRQETAKAPLRETLAAALLLGAEWTGDEALVDPFCGSGTIPIEAALIARRIAPGMRRRFAFMDWPAFDSATWNRVVDDAREGESRRSRVPIAGTDRDEGAVTAASANAQRAGVESDVVFGKASISDLAAVAASGLVATNPPYGVRIGDASKLRNLYARFGAVLRERVPGWRLAIYAADVRLARRTAIPLHSLYRTTNGGIRVVALAGRVADS